MKDLILKIKEVRKLKKKEVENRLNEFKEVNKSDDYIWFKELVFCILAANTSSRMASRITCAIDVNDFLTLSEKKLKNKMKSLSCRFYNRRSDFIISARKQMPLKKKLIALDDEEKRYYLVENVKGIGMKEASHFLRNTGHFNFAILDKHVKNILFENDLISEKLKNKSITKKEYLDIENILKKISIKLKMSQGELDFYLWYMKTNEILK